MHKPVMGRGQGARSSVADQAGFIPAGLSFGALAAGSMLALSDANAKVYAGFILGILALGGLAWIARKADRNVVRGLLLLYLLVIAAWALTKVSQQISDFGVYLRCGAPGWDEADSFRQWMRQCQSAWLPGNPTYWRRSLLYTLPIGMLGGEYLALRLVNAGLHIVAIVGLYHVVARSTSREQGILAAAALAVFPEYWFTTSLATSDNLVVPLLVLWLGLVTSSTSDGPSVWRTLTAAIIGVALDLLRDIGLVCVLTTLILAMLTPSRGRWKLLWLSVLTFGLTVVAGRLGAHLMQASIESAGLLARLTGHGITSSSAWADNYRWNQYVYPLLDPQTRSRYFAGLLTMDLQHGVLAAFQNWAAKTQVLLQGDGYYYFSAAPLDDNPDNFPIGNGTPASLPDIGVGFWLKGLTAAIAFFAVVGGARSRSQALGNVSLVFSCAFLFLVIGFGEIQPRYVTLLAPALCIMIAGLLAPASRSTAGTAADIGKGIACFAVAVAILLFALTTMLGRYLAPAPSLTGFAQEDARTIADASCNVTTARVSVEERFARIQFPNGQPSCYSFALQAAGDEQSLALHVVRDPILPLWKTPPVAPVTVSVSSDGPPDGPDLASVSLRTEVARQLRIPATGEGAKLRITIRVDGNLDESMRGVVIGFVQTASGRPARLLSSNDLK